MLVTQWAKLCRILSIEVQRTEKAMDGRFNFIFDYICLFILKAIVPMREGKRGRPSTCCLMPQMASVARVAPD